jgi:DNA-binding transcriptional MocR family regulator
MSAAVSRYFPDGTKATRPTGGMCLWVELPSEVSALTVFHRAMAAKISTAPGPLFSAKQRFHNFIRLNFGNPWTERIEGAVQQLGNIVKQLAKA